MQFNYNNRMLCCITFRDGISPVYTYPNKGGKLLNGAREYCFSLACDALEKSPLLPVALLFQVIVVYLSLLQTFQPEHAFILFRPDGVFIDFTLANTRRFYLSMCTS